MGRSWPRSLCICTTRPVTFICTGKAEVLIFPLGDISGEGIATTSVSGLRRACTLRLRIEASAGQHRITASRSKEIRSINVLLIGVFFLLQATKVHISEEKDK